MFNWFGQFKNKKDKTQLSGSERPSEGLYALLEQFSLEHLFNNDDLKRKGEVIYWISGCMIVLTCIYALILWVNYESISKLMVHLGVVGYLVITMSFIKKRYFNLGNNLWLALTWVMFFAVSFFSNEPMTVGGIGILPLVAITSWLKGRKWIVPLMLSGGILLWNLTGLKSLLSIDDYFLKMPHGAHAVVDIGIFIISGLLMYKAQRLSEVRFNQYVHFQKEALEASAQLNLTTKRMEQTFDLAPNLAITWLTESGNVHYWSKGSENLFGLGSNQIKAKPFTSIFKQYNEDRFFKQNEFLSMLSEIKRTGFPKTEQITFINQRKEEKSTLSTTFAMNQESQSGEFLFCRIDVDISALKEAQKQLEVLNKDLEARALERANELQKATNELTKMKVEVQKNQRINTISKMVADLMVEINSPISNAKLISTTLKQKSNNLIDKMQTGMKKSDVMSLHDQIQEGSQIIDESLDKLAFLFEQFKDVAIEVSDYEFKKVDSGSYINSLVNPYIVLLKQQDIEVSLMVEDFEFQTNDPLMEQMFKVLFDNILEHAFTSWQDDKFVKIKVWSELDYFNLKIEDSGRRLQSGDLEKIFSPLHGHQARSQNSQLQLMNAGGLSNEIETAPTVYMLKNKIGLILNGSVDAYLSEMNGLGMLIKFPLRRRTLKDITKT